MKIIRKEEQAKLDVLKAKAEAGDAEAQAKVGDMYLFSVGVDAADCEIAHKWYKKSAEQNCAEGIAKLAYLYELGYGKDGEIILRSDKAKARELYEKAAAMGNEFAINHLAKMK